VFKQFLYFSRGQQIGILVLLVLIVVVISINLLLPKLVTPAVPDNDSLFRAQVAAFEKSLENLPRSTYQSPFEKQSYKSYEDEQPQAELFPFDPNTLDSVGFVRLGLKSYVAKNIVNYRLKGGKFKTVALEQGMLAAMAGLDVAAGIMEKIPVGDILKASLGGVEVMLKSLSEINPESAFINDENSKKEFLQLEEQDKANSKQFQKVQAKTKRHADAGKSITLKPDWKIGETKQLICTIHAIQYQNNRLMKDTTLISHDSLTIKSQDDSAYFVNYKMENALINTGEVFCKSLGTELKDIEYIDVNCRIDKSTLAVMLLNSDEAETTLLTTYDRIMKIIRDKVPDQASKADKELKSAMELQKSQGFGIEDMLFHLLFPYNKQYVEGDTLRTIDAMANPLMAQQKNLVPTISYVSDVDKRKKTVTISVKRSLSSNTLKPILKGMTDSLTESIKSPINGMVTAIDKETKNNKSDGSKMVDNMFSMLNSQMELMMRSIRFEMTETADIICHQKSSWPSNVSRHRELKIEIGNNASVVLFDTRIEIR